MLKRYEFKTQRGANIELEIRVDHITTETVSLDGHEFETTCSKYRYNVASIKVNGKEFNGRFHDLAKNICIGHQGNQPLLVALPEDIKKDITKEEAAEANAKIEKMIRVEKTYADHYNMVMAAMEE